MALRRSPPASWRMSSSTLQRGQRKPPCVNSVRDAKWPLDGWSSACGAHTHSGLVVHTLILRNHLDPRLAASRREWPEPELGASRSNRLDDTEQEGKVKVSLVSPLFHGKGPRSVVGAP
jgi:hypothetical protein